MNFGFFLIFAILFFCAVWLFLSLAVYFVPVIVAYIRKHKNILQISILTVVLGWTFIGWLAALLWALNSDIDEEEC